MNPSPIVVENTKTFYAVVIHTLPDEIGSPVYPLSVDQDYTNEDDPDSTPILSSWVCFNMWMLTGHRL